MSDSSNESNKGGYVFVSYSHADEELVMPEVGWLEESGVRVWYDEEISAASRWRDAIAERIANCNLFVLYLSSNSAISKVCREELEFAIDQDRQILTIMVEEVDLPEGIRLAITHRQALMRFKLDASKYQERLLSTISDYTGSSVEAAGSVKFRQPKRRYSLVALASAVFVTALLSFVAAQQFTPDRAVSDSSPSYKLDLYFEDPEIVFTPNEIGSPLPGFTLTKAGDAIIFSGHSDGATHLYHRSLLTGEIRRYEGTLGAGLPIVSPDDLQIAFFIGNTLHRVAMDGGTPLRVGSFENPGFATWIYLDRIVIAHGDGRTISTVVPDTGNVKRWQTDQRFFRTGSVLPLADGKSAYYSTFDGVELVGENGLTIGEPVQGRYPQFVNGHLATVTNFGFTIYEADESQRLTGKFANWQVPDTPRLLSFSDKGVVAYPAATQGKDVLTWLSGETESIVAKTSGRFSTFAISPDNQYIAYGEIDPASRQTSLYLYDRHAGLSRPFGDSGGFPRHFVWMPDSSGLYIARGTEPEIVFHRVNTTTFELQEVGESGGPTSMSRDGRYVVRQSSSATHLFDSETGKLEVVTDRPGDWGGAIAPDGSGLVFTSDRSGSYQVYYKPLPIDNQLIQVSTNPGSEEARWNADGSRLYFRNGNRIMVSDRSVHKFSPPRVLYQGAFKNIPGISYDVSANEESVLIIPANNLTVNRLKIETNIWPQIEAKFEAQTN